MHISLSAAPQECDSASAQPQPVQHDRKGVVLDHRDCGASVGKGRECNCLALPVSRLTAPEQQTLVFILASPALPPPDSSPLLDCLPDVLLSATADSRYLSATADSRYLSATADASVR